jgi:hypothetical protein
MKPKTYDKEEIKLKAKTRNMNTAKSNTQNQN